MIKRRHTNSSSHFTHPLHIHLSLSQPLASLAKEPQNGTEKQASSGISFSIWPPTKRTRDAITSRLIETLSTQSVLSKRYGTIPQEQASKAALRIEEEAFSVATAVASSEKDGLEVLQLYSKEISKRMLETVKARAGSGVNGDDSATETASADVTPRAVENEESGASRGSAVLIHGLAGQLKCFGEKKLIQNETWLGPWADFDVRLQLYSQVFDQKITVGGGERISV
ncbi:hypothetical protein SADUNF_Sadunf14G0011600 [Salix dunnii]|uniref:WPP domain-containing protein n=1 Tax=Salix dunnii TaxID=1413687 RepID=A0A835JK11_9ROSI|nr:hypothetical protein SADUNF_Sadunf14G0011600 [Salix dunnii]